MVLDELENPNREITRCLLDIMKDLLNHKLMMHENTQGPTKKERPKVYAKILYHNPGMGMFEMNPISQYLHI